MCSGAGTTGKVSKENTLLRDSSGSVIGVASKALTVNSGKETLLKMNARGWDVSDATNRAKYEKIRQALIDAGEEKFINVNDNKKTGVVIANQELTRRELVNYTNELQRRFRERERHGHTYDKNATTKAIADEVYKYKNILKKI